MVHNPNMPNGGNSGQLMKTICLLLRFWGKFLLSVSFFMANRRGNMFTPIKRFVFGGHNILLVVKKSALLAWLFLGCGGACRGGLVRIVVASWIGRSIWLSWWAVVLFCLDSLSYFSSLSMLSIGPVGLFNHCRSFVGNCSSFSEIVDHFLKSLVIVGHCW